MAETENKLLEMKQANFMKAINRDPSAYVPLLISASNATIAYKGHTVTEVWDDPYHYALYMTEIFDDMWADAIWVFGAVYGKWLDGILGPNQNVMGPDGVTPEHVQISLMKRDEYDLLIADPDAFITEVMLPRKYPRLFEDREHAKTALKAYNDDNVNTLIMLGGALNQMAAEKYGIFAAGNSAEMRWNPMDLIFDYLRGFSGSLTDLRRQPEKMMQAIDTLWEVRTSKLIDHPIEKFPYVLQFPHIAPYLSPKQFEQFYWKYEKKIVEKIAEYDNKLLITLENKWRPVFDCLKDVPKDSMILCPEDDDIVDTYRYLGDHHIIGGGVRMVDVKTKDKATLLDGVKETLDICARDGGFLFVQDKCWICPDDISQNMIDVYNFVHDYTSNK